ncbi:MAG: hypothetical protein AAGH99_06615 [Planctomycetota bacterium]
MDHVLGDEAGFDLGEAGDAELGLGGEAVGDGAEAAAEAGQRFGAELEGVGAGALGVVHASAFGFGGLGFEFAELAVGFADDGADQRDDGVVFVLELPGVEPDGDGGLLFGCFAVLDHAFGEAEEGGLAAAPAAVDADGERAGAAEGGAGDDLGLGLGVEDVSVTLADGVVVEQVERFDRLFVVPGHGHSVAEGN